WTAIPTPGAETSCLKVGSGPTPGTADPHGRTFGPTALTGHHRWSDLRQTGTASTTSPATSGSGQPLRGWPTTRRRTTRRCMHAVRLAQKTSANRTGELSRGVGTCAPPRTAIATDPRLDKVMPYAAQPVISDFAACSLPSLRVSQRPQAPALHTPSVIARRLAGPVGRGRSRPIASSTPRSKNAAGSSGQGGGLLDKAG